jgi:ornithine cyclodeaminase
MITLDDSDVEQLLDYPAAIEALHGLFLAVADSETENFPFVRQALRGDRGFCGVKSGCNYRTGGLGLKAGGYWNGNARLNLDRHQSTVLLLDIDTGQPTALVAGNSLTAIRTAAASALACRELSRPDARRLSVLGTGRQALCQVDAVRTVRPIETVRAWSPTAEHVRAFGRAIEARGLAFEAAPTPAAAVARADIVVTVTPARTPLLRAADLSPGVHLSAMGSDMAGKQELDAEILRRGRTFADDVAQASAIGESQHLAGASAGAPAGVRPFSDLLAGRAEGRRGEAEVTVYDGTGLALQDIAAAQVVLARARAPGAVA